jgi:hypothetical protein
VTDLQSDLSILVAETRDVMVDIDGAVATPQELGSSLDAAVAESHDLSTDMEMRIKVEESQLAALDMNITSAWDTIQSALNAYEEKFVRLQRIGDTAYGVLLGSPEIFVLHRLSDDSVVKCDCTAMCENCGRPRRILVAWNFYDSMEQSLRILVCDEMLSRAMLRAAPPPPPAYQRVAIRNVGKQDDSYREFSYQFDFTSAGPENMPLDFFNIMDGLQLFDLRDLDVTKLAGSML